MKRHIRTLIVLAVLLVLASVAPGSALATPFIPPSGELVGWIVPGIGYNYLPLDPGMTQELMVYNPGRLLLLAQHDDYKGVVFYVWAPDKVGPLRRHEQGLTDETVLFTGVGSVCSDKDRNIGLYWGCTTKWDSSARYVTGYWLVRVYNPTSSPILVKFRAEGEWLCSLNC